MFNFILERLRDPAVLRGLVNFVTGALATVGITIAPEMSEYIISLGLALVGLVAMVYPGKKA